MDTIHASDVSRLTNLHIELLLLQAWLKITAKISLFSYFAGDDMLSHISASINAYAQSAWRSSKVVLPSCISKQIWQIKLRFPKILLAIHAICACWLLRLDENNRLWAPTKVLSYPWAASNQTLEAVLLLSIDDSPTRYLVVMLSTILLKLVLRSTLRVFLWHFDPCPSTGRSRRRCKAVARTSSDWNRLIRIVTTKKISKVRSYLQISGALLLLWSASNSSSSQSFPITVLSYLWAAIRAIFFALLLLSTCDLSRNHISFLPNEILHQILKHADLDLPSLSLVNKYFRVMAEPLLYESIRMVKEPRSGPQNSHPLLLLIRTIQKRPEVTMFVRHIYFHLHGMAFEKGHYRTPLARYPGSLEAKISSECAAFIVGSGLAYRIPWCQELRAGTLDAFVIYLIVRLPLLESISLQGYTWNKIQMGSIIIQRTLDNKYVTPFKHLIRLDLRNPVDVHERRASKLTLNHFQDLLRISTLRSLSADMIESEMGLWPFPSPLPPHSSIESSLTSLSITVLHEQNLERLLSNLPALEELTWTFWLNYKRPMGSNEMYCDRVRDALLRRSDTLKVLRIIPTHGYGRQWRANRVGIQGSLDLSTFGKLHTLEIPFNMLLGGGPGVTMNEVLPLSLKHLKLIEHHNFRQYMFAWDADSLLQTLLPFLEGAQKEAGGHNAGDDAPRIQTLTSILWLHPYRRAYQLWHKHLHTELITTCFNMGIKFFGDYPDRERLSRRTVSRA